MTQEAINKLLVRMSSALNIGLSSFQCETSVEDDCCLFSVCGSEGTLLVQFAVVEDCIRVLRGGELFAPIQTDYEYTTVCQFLSLIISFIYPYISREITISCFLSVLVGEKVRSWAEFLGRLLDGTGLQNSLLGNIFSIEEDYFRVDSNVVVFSGLVDKTIPFRDTYELVKVLLSLLDSLLLSYETEISLFDTDPALLEEPIETDSAPGFSSPSFDSSTDIDLDVESPSNEEPLTEPPVEEENLDVE